jgi:DinB superfamily
VRLAVRAPELTGSGAVVRYTRAMTETDLRYPIGKFQRPQSLTPEERDVAVAVIADTPKMLRHAVAGLGGEQLDTPYRPGGWTVRQVVHHVPDSHVNAYVRMKLALTEDEPTVRPYLEARWAELPDGSKAPIEMSLNLLDGLHQRWTEVLRGLTPQDWQRHLVHPEMGRQSLEQVAALYAWHGRHHVAHITALCQRHGWG